MTLPSSDIPFAHLKGQKTKNFTSWYTVTFFVYIQKNSSTKYLDHDSWSIVEKWLGPSGKMNDCHNFCETVIFIRSMQPATDLYQLIFFGSTNDWSVVVLNSTKGQQPSSSMPHLLQRWSYPLRLRRKLPETTAGFTLINLTPPERYLVGSSEIN